MFGKYTCIASNKMGSIRKIVSLTEGAKPGMPHISIASIHHDKAILNIEVSVA